MLRILLISQLGRKRAKLLCPHPLTLEFVAQTTRQMAIAGSLVWAEVSSKGRTAQHETKKGTILSKQEKMGGVGMGSMAESRRTKREFPSPGEVKDKTLEKRKA